MLRWLLSSLSVLALCVVLTAAADKDKADKNKADKDKSSKTNKGHKDAKITKVDAKKGTVTVKMKDKSGKETEKTFKLAEDIRYFDSTGKAVAIDVFTSGDEVLILEAKGQIKQMKKKGKNKTEKNKTKKKAEKEK